MPDSAIIYAQVVECPTLWKWNKLNDLADAELDIVLRTPQKVKKKNLFVSSVNGAMRLIKWQHRNQCYVNVNLCNLAVIFKL